MAVLHSREAAPALAGSGSSKSVLLGGGDTKTGSKRHAARQRLVRLTARLDALAVWRDDLLCRIAVAEEKLHADGNLYFSRLYPDEMDDLFDAVAAWRLAAARVVLDLAPERRGGAPRRADA